MAEGRTRLVRRAVEEKRGRAIAGVMSRAGERCRASGAANEVMSFQEGEDSRERERPVQYLRRADLAADGLPWPAAPARLRGQAQR
jgi:hypothetical protein